MEQSRLSDTPSRCTTVGTGQRHYTRKGPGNPSTRLHLTGVIKQRLRGRSGQHPGSSRQDYRCGVAASSTMSRPVETHRPRHYPDFPLAGRYYVTGRHDLTRGGNGCLRRGANRVSASMRRAAIHGFRLFRRTNEDSPSQTTSYTPDRLVLQGRRHLGPSERGLPSIGVVPAIAWILSRPPSGLELRPLREGRRRG